MNKTIISRAQQTNNNNTNGGLELILNLIENHGLIKKLKSWKKKLEIIWKIKRLSVYRKKSVTIICLLRLLLCKQCNRIEGMSNLLIILGSWHQYKQNGWQMSIKKVNKIILCSILEDNIHQSHYLHLLKIGLILSFHL
jgi:hypothetical protein